MLEQLPYICVAMKGQATRLRRTEKQMDKQIGD